MRLGKNEKENLQRLQKERSEFLNAQYQASCKAGKHAALEWNYAKLDAFNTHAQRIYHPDIIDSLEIDSILQALSRTLNSSPNFIKHMYFNSETPKLQQLLGFLDGVAFTTNLVIEGCSDFPFYRN